MRRNGVRTIQLQIHQVVLALMALFSVGFMDMTGIYLVMMIVVLVMFAGRRIGIDRVGAVLLFFSVFYFVPIAISEGMVLDKVIKFLIAPWSSYVIGRTITMSSKRITVTRVAFVLVVGFFLRGMLNYVMSVAMYGMSFDSNYRLAFDFWQNRNISVVSAALYYSPMALMAMAMLFWSKGKQRWFAVIAIALSVLATFQYQNRTLIVALLIVLIMLIIQFMRRHDIRAQNKAFCYGAIGICGLLCLVIWVTDANNVRSIISGTRLYERLLNRDAGRFDIWFDFLSQAWKYPFGGRQATLSEGVVYVHNLWLDVYHTSGIIPFFLLVLFTFQAYKMCRVFVRKGYRDEQSWVVVFCLAGIAIVSAVEPILEANPYFFYIPLFVLGGIAGKVRSVPSSEERDIAQNVYS